MNTSELVTATHLARKAVIYIRQSTPHQVLSNQESLRLQYNLKQKAQALGWRLQDIEIIDSDLGLTATSAEHRHGFQSLVAKVSLGQVGIILSSEVTRLSRNCSDWYPLLDVCGYKGCLIADGDGLYDPGSLNGRLLLGLKGQLSELELYTIRARMRAGLLNKAARGELAQPLPVGLVRDESGIVIKNPNLEVQARLKVVFDSFLRLRSARQTMRFFMKEKLLLPRLDHFGGLVWRTPTPSAILNILHNPAYAGAFVYGRHRYRREMTGKVVMERLPIDQWQYCVQDKYPAYISWETFEQIQAMLADNRATYDQENRARGTPRAGATLLQGIVYCGHCGHQMRVTYRQQPVYLCDYWWRQSALPPCQRVMAPAVDAAVVAAFFQALSPLELDAYTQAMVAIKETAAKLEKAHQQQLDRLRYQAALAQRQYDRVDPDNRLVAAELERRWEEALRALKQAEADEVLRQQAYEQQLEIPTELKQAFTAIGEKLPQIWEQDRLTMFQKKAFLRCLIDKVVLERSIRDRVQVRIVWQGGETTALTIPLPVMSLAELADLEEMMTLILDLCQAGHNDQEIAAQLTQLGFRSPKAPTQVLPSTVSAIRREQGLYRQQHNPSRCPPGYLTLSQLAQVVNRPRHWLHYRIKTGRIQAVKDAQTGLYLFPDTPETIALFRQFVAGECDHISFPISKRATDL
jgi:DNA invertase Pin-like site-specific DNA recombinase